MALMQDVRIHIAATTERKKFPVAELEVCKNMLESFSLRGYLYYLIEVAHVKMEGVSQRLVDLLGLNGVEDFSLKYIQKNMHPEDLLHFNSNEQKITALFTQLPVTKVLQYKVSNHYRLLTASGVYCNVVIQSAVVQKHELEPIVKIVGVLNGRVGEQRISWKRKKDVGNIKGTLPADSPVFTLREKEVLALMLTGKSDVVIAELLFISKNTVHTHRKNIRKKAGCKSVAELCTRAVQEKWI